MNAQQRSRAMFTLLAAAAWTPAALAADQAFSTSIPVVGGYVHPAVVVGFNPQPDPPKEWRVIRGAAGVAQIALEGRGTSLAIDADIRRDDGVELISLALDSAPRSNSELPPDPCSGEYPPDPCAPADAPIVLEATFSDGNTWALVLDVASPDGAVDTASIVAYQPDRELPALRVELAISTGRSYDNKLDAVLAVQVYDDGQLIALH